MIDALPHAAIVVADFEFEFGGHNGNQPRPVCMVAKELRSGKEWRIWRGDFGSTPPFPTGHNCLFVAYYASAELSCFRALGWPMPARILDLYTEFRDLLLGLTVTRRRVQADMRTHLIHRPAASKRRCRMTNCS
jgi:DNA polymerase I